MAMEYYIVWSVMLAKGTLPKLINALDYLGQEQTPNSRRTIKRQFQKYGIEFYPFGQSILVSESCMTDYLGRIRQCSSSKNEVNTGMLLAHSQRPKDQSKLGNLQELLAKKMRKHT
jgi:hypothetical protein